MATAAAPRASPPVLLPLLVSSGVFVAVFAALGAVLVGDASFGLWRWRGPLQLPSLGAGGRVFSLEELRQFDGSDPSKPIYLSIKHRVFDVTAGREFYGPGGGYHAFAGRDASRGFLTGCFANSDNHDLRGLSAEQLRSLDDWVAFYVNHDKYKLVGELRVDVDPAAPLPSDKCDKGGGR